MWHCPKCKSEIDEDDVINCWNCNYERVTSSNISMDVEGAASIDNHLADTKEKSADNSYGYLTRVACVAASLSAAIVPIVFFLGIIFGPGIGKNGKVEFEEKCLIVIHIVMFLMAIGVYFERWIYAFILMALSLMSVFFVLANGEIKAGFYGIIVTIIFAYAARRISIKNKNLTFGIM